MLTIRLSLIDFQAVLARLRRTRSSFTKGSAWPRTTSASPRRGGKRCWNPQGVGPIEAVEIEIPERPVIEEEEADASVAAAPATTLRESTIKPGGLFDRSRKMPTPPIRSEMPPEELSPKGETTEIPATTRDPGHHYGHSLKKPAGWARWLPKAICFKPSPTAEPKTQRTLDRLAKPPKELRVCLPIPWHQVALFVCLLFGGAGAYLASSGQHHVEKLLRLLGLATDSEHSFYISRLSFMEPEAIVTLDVHRAVQLYKRWSKGEAWPTVGDLDEALTQFAESFDLMDIDRCTLAMDAEGHTLALISTKREWERRDLVQDLGRGLLSLKKVGKTPVHEGFVGRRTEIKFAMLNPKTIVIGDPALAMQFLSAPEPPPSDNLIDRPT